MNFAILSLANIYSMTFMHACSNFYYEKIVTAEDKKTHAHQQFIHWFLDFKMKVFSEMEEIC